jgi:DNA-binding XRE family transcriptional regulator
MVENRILILIALWEQEVCCSIHTAPILRARCAVASTTLRKTLRSRGHRQLIELLVSARQEAELTQRDLASRLKRPHSFIGRIEAGERRVDVIEFIEIARVLSVDPHKLLDRLLK